MGCSVSSVDGSVTTSSALSIFSEPVSVFSDVGCSSIIFLHS
ncbi:hypothetical protein CoNPh36_CDS0005 [Staphylococcus phage S-CoN_Ph36]|nr:hypothetical protein CoNPh36_CDS0005 [Staphylococcus phage S-CoN_Ph36]